MTKVFANGRSILHKGDGNTHVSAPPDVCKVPTPGGPVPTPFVNSAQDSMLSKGSKTTTIAGNAIALADSEISLSSGDEPGTLGGLVSSKFKGKMTWSGSSTDVKVEGKGVTRFLDPTMHNGNTFNVCFIAKGGTGLAYGDDAKCRLCTGSEENHRVHETPEVKGFVDSVFQALGDRFKDQRPLIDRYLELRYEYARKKARLARAADAAETRGLTARAARISARRKWLDGLYEGLLVRINAQLQGMGPVLRLDRHTQTYMQGYMVGVCICKCPQRPKMLASCSGMVSPGFKAAVADTPFTRVDTFKMSDYQRASGETEGRTWTCAAPKLLQAGGASGHKVKSMSERWYSPVPSRPEMDAKVQTSVGVTHLRTEKEGEAPQEKKLQFGHGESVPSCAVCQKLLPEMLCGNHKECA
ncbi:DUF4150 domain-containing protein [Hyalangium gracile]|uniref:DUF4150 domain-containing protein n=1 Tax=Hyalangium gracile TaxID=394092 RepID=UPI001CCF8252|nr:DUF4150 domain-containing protein [Hyalangium gracile]